MPKYLGLDLSMSSPGFAVIEVKKRVPYLIEATHVKTDSSDPYSLRTKHIEQYAALFIRKHKPVDYVVREAFTSKIPRTNYSIFSAWNAVDRALGLYGYTVNTADIPQQTVKKTLLGKGKAEKEEVAEAVRRLLRLPSDYKFGADDESDACAIVLAHLIRDGAIQT